MNMQKKAGVKLQSLHLHGLSHQMAGMKHLPD